MNCASVVLRRAWVCVRGFMFVYAVFLLYSMLEDVGALYLNVIVQILFDIARTLVCLKFVHGLFCVFSCVSM